jgi:tetratricopeptide (TPR) repeat protein
MPDVQTAESLCQQARQCVRERRIGDAIGFYRQALQLDSRDVRAHEGLATAAFLSGEYDLAIQHFQQLSKLDPRRADPLVNLGAVYNRRREYDAAVRVLRQALLKNRRCAEAFYNLGIAHRGQNQLSMAVSAYKEAIRLSPQMAEAYQNLANAYVELGALQQAILNFRRALEINPDFEKARRGMEAAQQMSERKASHENPFGRLVDLKQIQEKGAAETEYRELSHEERLEDRMAVHRLASTLERTAGTLLEEIRDNLAPSVLGLAHTLAQVEDQRQLFGAHESFRSALERYRAAIGPLLRAGDELQAHEEALKSQRQAR